MSTQAPPQVELNYGLDDVPKPFPKAIGLGLQHVLTAFGATITVPLILGPAMGFDLTQIAILISSVFIASGLATVVQVMFGTRLPIVQGVSFAFLGPFFAIIAAHPGEDAMRYIAGAIMAGAIVEMIVGYGGLMGVLRRFITPITIGPVIALIGLSLFGAASGTAQGNWWLALLTVAFIFVYGLILAQRVRMFSLFPILLAVLSAYLVALVLTAVGVFEAGSASAVSFEGIGDAPWLRGFVPGEGGIIFPWGTPLFDLGFFVAIIAAYLASTIESFGDYHAISRIVGKGDPTKKQINRGIGAEGIGCFITGLVGGFASTSYSENIGLVGLTKVASRVVVIIGAIALVVLGLASKVGAVIATIPSPIVGGIYLALFGLIAAVGLSNLQRADMDSQRNLMIVGFVLFMGLVVPNYFGGLPDDWTLLGVGWLTDLAKSIGGSGIAVAAIVGLLLDNIIPGTDLERGVGTYDIGAPPADQLGMEGLTEGRHPRLDRPTDDPTDRP
ncbi:uracil-xanthine permease family protein [Nitriliruptor alkaliphilus]|uniref:uracil-xanthine permease family protein n=1 Tax=Nitriliruptor alkaliphilus TaxID=427918 RepID=UPI0009FABDF4|nr:solute carrier family 23 protein [Nitriliruptor alkaliphilus]